MRRSGLLLATIVMTVFAVLGVKAAGWFEEPGRRPISASMSRHSFGDVERWYRAGQDKHWRSLFLQTR